MLTGLVAVFLLFDATIHIVDIDVVKTSMTELGYPTHPSLTIGVIELCCVVLYLLRRTAPLVAALLTGFLGGAIASNLRVDNLLVSTALFPVYVGPRCDVQPPLFPQWKVRHAQQASGDRRIRNDAGPGAGQTAHRDRRAPNRSGPAMSA